MGIERFYVYDVYIYAPTEGATAKADRTWAQISGSPIKGSLSEMSGGRGISGMASVSKGDVIVCIPSTITVLPTYKVKVNSRCFELTEPPRLIAERAGHHQELYLHETPEFAL